MTSASEENPAAQGVRGLTSEVQKYLGAGNPMLAGPVEVSLTISLSNPVTPDVAAKMMTLQIIESGLDIFTFEVKDVGTGDTYYVRSGQVFTEAELEEQLEALREQVADGDS